MGYFGPIFKLGTPWAEPVLTPGASYEQGDAIYQI